MLAADESNMLTEQQLKDHEAYFAERPCDQCGGTGNGPKAAYEQ